MTTMSIDLMARRPEPTVMATGTHAALVTFKQAEILFIIDMGPTTLQKVSEVAQDQLDQDLLCGERPMYWGVSVPSIRSTVQTMLRRGWCSQLRDGRYVTTTGGHELLRRLDWA